jgi:hypothetical protein
MSIKDIFQNKKALSPQNLQSASLGIETPQFISAANKDKSRYRPIVDYTDISNFAKFGLAEMYYEDSFNRILKTFPFDGSGKEKQEWKNSSTDFDLYIFENAYPKNYGLLNFGYDSLGSTSVIETFSYSKPITPAYISVKGVMNTGSFQIDPSANMNQLSTGFKYSNVYNEEYNRTSNLRMNPASGSTVEFWFKNSPTQISSASVLCDIWNGNTFGDPDYGRLTLELGGSPTGSSELYVTYLSGTSGFSKQLLHPFTGSTNWNHYSVTFYQDDTYFRSQLFLNGNYTNEISALTTLEEVTGSMVMTIGSLAPTPYLGFGSVSGSMDEFRYWKERRTHEEISRFHFTNVNGGSNNDDAYKDLGIYFKFNEGITGLSGYDNVVLDYSGRTSHGKIFGALSRENNSAMILASASISEVKDPVVWPQSPELYNTLEAYKSIGRSHDQTRSNSFYYYFPSHMIEDDSSGELKRLSQIVGSYFDNMLLQIKDLSRLKDPLYVSGSNGPSPFSDRKLMHQGFVAPEIFENADALAQIYSRDETRDFTENLSVLKNLIYDNIYNNIINIMKSKGTEKSFKNLMHCFGIDENLISINHYSDNEVYDISERYGNKTVSKKFVNFNAGNYTGYLKSDPISMDFNFQNAAQTLEAECYFGKKFDVSSKFFQNDYPYMTSSICGLSSSVDNEFGIYAYMVRDSFNSPSGRFVLTSSAASGLGLFPLNLTSSLIEDLYDNNKWNIVITVSPQKRDILETSGTLDSLYDVIFTGKSYISDQEIQSFSLSSSISSEVGKHLLTSSKFIKAGANLSNLSDVKIGSLKYYCGEYSSETMDLHARDTKNYGFFAPTVELPSGSFNVSKFKKLIASYEFDSLTASDGSGGFSVSDITSGSEDGRYGNYDLSYNKQIPINGYSFDPDSSNFINKIYVESAEQKLPEDVASTGQINILEQDFLKYTQNTVPIKSSISFEKSMANAISREMLNFLGSVNSYSDIVFNNSNKYATRYDVLESLRSTFFENVTGDIDFEKYYELYKWIDGSLSEMLNHLVPASAAMSPHVRNVIESHIFERNKVWNKLPQLKFVNQNILGTFKGVNKRKRSSIAPPTINQFDNANWWLTMFDPLNLGNSSGVSLVDTSRKLLLNAKVSELEVADNRMFEANVDAGDFNKIQKIDSQILNNSTTYLIVTVNEINNLNVLNKEYFKSNFKITSYQLENAVPIPVPVNFVGIPNNIKPFYFVSSSMSGGYIDEFHSKGLSANINGIHEDTTESTIQSSYTKNVAGGYLHRHNKIASERNESFWITFDNDGYIIKVPQRLAISRDHFSKTIATMKNIPGVNYDYNYEIVNGGDRTGNNIWLRSHSGTVALSSEVANLLPKKNNEVFLKQKSESFLTTRFSAPGANNETSVGYLDNAAEEYCVYSTMNYRNLKIRKDSTLSSSIAFDLESL